MLKDLKKILILSLGIKLSRKDLEIQEIDCEIYQAKQTRNSFGDARTRATRLLQVIHTNLCGPIDPPT